MNEKKYYLQCFAGVADKDMIYIYDNPLGLIMKYNLKDFSYEIIGQVQDDALYKVSVIDMLKNEEYLYLIMFRRPGIIRFNLIDRSIEKYLFNDSFFAPNELMWKSFIYESKIWVFSVCAGRKILIFDYYTGEFRKGCSITNLFKKKNIKIESENYLSHIFQINNKIWGAVCGTTYIFSINMSEMDISIFPINCEGINSFDYDENGFWITVSNSSQIMKWDPDYGIIDSYYVNEINFDDYPNCYVGGSRDRILVVPNSDKDFCIIDRETKLYSFLPLVGRYQRLSLNRGAELFVACLRICNTLILLPYDIDKIVIVNLEDKSVEYKESLLSKADYEKVYIINKLKSDRVEEDLAYRLDDYIKYVNNEACYLNNGTHKKKIGKKILEEM